VQIDVAGRIKNIRLSSAQCLQPLYELIVNSLQAVEGVQGESAHSIHIKVQRAGENTNEGVNDNAPIVSFSVTDDGIGFTDENMRSFETSDSTYKASKGCKGIGRFSWLKVFERAHITSTFLHHDGSFKKRDFKFSPEFLDGISDATATASQSQKRQTHIRLENIKKSFSKSCPRKLAALGYRITDHCLQYFLLPNCPSIHLSDGFSDINLLAEFRQNVTGTALTSSFEVKGKSFDIVGIKLFSSDQSTNEMHYCANYRSVEVQKMSSIIPNLKGKLTDADGRTFRFVACVSSEYLDTNINSERTQVEIPEMPDDEDGTFVSMGEIRNAVAREVTTMLGNYLEPIKQQKRERIEKALTLYPRYRPLKSYIDGFEDQIPADASEDKLEAEFHKVYHNLEVQVMDRAKHFLSENVTNESEIDEYEKKFEEFYSIVSDLGRSDLAQHITHRKLILDLLEKKLSLNDSGSYEKERAIHKLIFPMGKTSEEVKHEQQNLWLLDEKLTYHDYLASDKKMADLEDIDSPSADRPDIVIYNTPFALAEGESPHSSITIVEFKRPGRPYLREKTKNPITQTFDYIRQIRAGKTKDYRGRQLIGHQNTPFYIYIVCDFSEDLILDAQNAGLHKTPCGTGFFGYNPIPDLNCYVEVTSYNKMLADAKKRNRVLFDKLIAITALKEVLETLFVSYPSPRSFRNVPLNVSFPFRHFSQAGISFQESFYFRP